MFKYYRLGCEKNIENMSSYEEKPGFMGQIRKLSRRLSATLLDAQKGQNLLGQRAKNSIYSHDSDSNLRINGVPAAEIVEKYGTPTYVYDANRIVDNYYDYLGSLQNINNFMLCYPVKVRLKNSFKRKQKLFFY